MVLLLYISAAAGFALLGGGAIGILYGRRSAKDLHWEDSLLAGYFMCIGLTEAAHLAALFLHRSFSDCVKLFMLLFAAAVAVSLALIVWQSRRRRVMLQEHSRGEKGDLPWTRAEGFAFLVFFLLVLLQIVMIAMKQYVQLRGDMTVETVNSFLSTNAIYQVNPLTGQPYELGMPSRLKILCLPTLYGILCRCFGLSAMQVVWQVIPVITLILSYLAYSLLARTLFPKSRLKRGCFLTVAAILFMVGDYMYGMDGFGLLHGGFYGVTIRGAVLLPYMLSLVLRNKWRLAILCILAEACIVWTLYGLGVSALMAVVLLGLKLLGRHIQKRKGGKEEIVCGNS